MPLTYDEAIAAVTAPGERFETEVVDVRGVPTTVFRHAPGSLRDVFAAARGHGDETFLVYEDERWSFADVMAQVDALGALLVERYGVAPGDRVAIGMRNYPEWVVAFAAITSVGAIAVSLNAWWTDDELGYGPRGLRRLGADRRPRAGRADRALPRQARRPGAGRPARRRRGAAASTAGRTCSAPGCAAARRRHRPRRRRHDPLHLGHHRPPKGAVSTHRAVVQALLGYACRAAVDRLRRAPEPGADEPPPRRRPASFILIVPLFHVTGRVPVMLSASPPG